MIMNSPRGKSVTLLKFWGSNIFSSKKGHFYINIPPSVKEPSVTTTPNFGELSNTVVTPKNNSEGGKFFLDLPILVL